MKNHMHDSVLANPKVTNTTYSYDSYGNPVWVNSSGDIERTGDKKHERYAYAVNSSAYVVDRVCNQGHYLANLFFFTASLSGLR